MGWHAKVRAEECLVEKANDYGLIEPKGNLNKKQQKDRQQMGWPTAACVGGEWWMKKVTTYRGGSATLRPGAAAVALPTSGG